MIPNNRPKLKIDNESVIFVSNYEFLWKNEEELLKIFSVVGEIVSFHILTDRQGGKIAYFQYHHSRAAKRACNMMQAPQTRKIQVGILTGKGDSSLKLHIKNLSQCFNNEKLYSIFKEYGKIKHAYIKKDICGKSLGFGFVTFVKEEDATNACTALDGETFNGKVIKINFCQSIHHRVAYLVALNGNLIEGQTTIIHLPKNYNFDEKDSTFSTVDTYALTFGDEREILCSTPSERRPPSLPPFHFVNSQILKPNLKLYIPPPEMLTPVYVSKEDNFLTTIQTSDKTMIMEKLVEQVKVVIDTYLNQIIKQLKEKTTLDLHMMLEKPEKLEDYVKHELQNILFD